MIGKPKYKRGDRVSFSIMYENKTYNLEGEVYIVDAYGTFEQDEEPSYDIMVDDWFGQRCLFKHFKESSLES